MIRFFIALWASKLYLFLAKKRGKRRSDRAGMLALKLCPKFLNYINKPKLVIAITGTNGKTTVSNLVYNILKQDYKVAFNDWGANMLPGQVRCLMDAVSVFNKPNKDVAVLEVDELISKNCLKDINPNYIIVTNICRDSIRRNANPDYIFNRINDGCRNCHATLILNADDPISSFITSEEKKIFFSINGNDKSLLISKTNDFSICPQCGSKIIYDYRNYRHIGKMHCSNCSFKSYDGNLVVTDINIAKKEIKLKTDINIAKKEIKLKTDNKKEEIFPIISETIFNIYNVLATISLFIDLGYDKNILKKRIKQLSIPSSRESVENYNGVELVTYLTKGQNVSAASTVFSYLNTVPKKKQLVLLLDEVYGNLNAIETITWLYETDFELLNSDNIDKIIVGSNRYLDYKLRLLLAGIDPKKIICLQDEKETITYLNLDGKSTIYILHEADAVSKARNLREQIKNKIGGNK